MVVSIKLALPNQLIDCRDEPRSGHFRQEETLYRPLMLKSALNWLSKAKLTVLMQMSFWTTGSILNWPKIVQPRTSRYSKSLNLTRTQAATSLTKAFCWSIAPVMSTFATISNAKTPMKHLRVLLRYKLALSVWLKSFPRMKMLLEGKPSRKSQGFCEQKRLRKDFSFFHKEHKEWKLPFEMMKMLWYQKKSPKTYCPCTYINIVFKFEDIWPHLFVYFSLYVLHINKPT